MNKHKMSKKLLATIMTFAMLITMFPSGVFAAPGDGGNGHENGQVVSGTEQAPVTASENGVTVNKYVTGDAESGYKLTLEGYASNELTTTFTSTPLDIVLVLDVSGSMKDDFTEASHEHWVPVYGDEINEYESYYIYVDGDTKYVMYNRWEQKWYYTERHGWSEWDVYVEPKTSEQDEDPHHVQFYTTNHTPAISKMTALKNAVSGFISQVDEKNNGIEGNNKHRISIVKFAGEKNNNVGNSTYREGWYT